MAHKRKLQKMQAEEAAASMADEEPPVSEFTSAAALRGWGARAERHRRAPPHQSPL